MKATMKATARDGMAGGGFHAGDEIIRGAAGRASLTEPEAKRLLAGFGVKVPAGCTISSSAALRQPAVAALRAPLVAKIVASEVLHKSDSGGVALDLQDVAAVADAIDAIAARHGQVAIQGYLVEEMAPPGIEMMIGGFVDDSFGPAILVGMGGVLVEVLDDVSMRLCPITRDDACDMLASLRGVALLDGVRGRPAVDADAIVDAMLAIGGADGLLMRHHPAIASLDVNPLIASNEGCVAVDACVLLRAPGDRLLVPPGKPAGDLRRLLCPRSIAVVGASADGAGPGNNFIRNLRGFGYAGELSVIHPTAREIDGVPCHASLAALPETVDYAYIAIPAARTPVLLAGAAGKVAFAQVMSSGFAEVAGGKALQAELLEAARQGGARIVGPNCLGLHSASARVTFIDRMKRTSGSFSVVSQSGGMGVDILRRGQARGLGFCHLVTIGNAADVSAVELVAELLRDEATEVIGLYLEDLSDGRALFDLLRPGLGSGTASKPIVLLKGGRSVQGQRAAQSHTGAMASNERLWTALARQTGMVMVDTLDEFIDAALAIQLLKPNPARALRRICLFGNGGGTSVVACDTFARHGLAVEPFGLDIIKELEALRLPPGASVQNPIDTPVGVLAKDQGAIAEAILAIVQRAEEVDAIVLHLNLPVIIGYYAESLLSNLLDAALRARNAARREVYFLLVLRSDGSETIDAIRREYRNDAIGRGIPVYDEIPQAALALAAVASMERRGRFVHSEPLS